MKDKKVKINKEKVKNIVIIVLILVIVFGASFMATGLNSEDTSKKNTNSNSDTTTNEKSVTSDSSKAEEESASISKEEQKELEEIKVERYLELKEESSPSVIYIARPTCHYCEIQNPIIKNIAYEYNLNLYYLNTDDMSADEISEFTKSDESFEEGFGTPCTIIVKDGKIVDKMEGLTDRENMVNFFKENGIISE